jgi:hypothetical protein
MREDSTNASVGGFDYVRKNHCFASAGLRRWRPHRYLSGTLQIPSIGRRC